MHKINYNRIYVAPTDVCITGEELHGLLKECDISCRYSLIVMLWKFEDSLKDMNRNKNLIHVVNLKPIRYTVFLVSACGCNTKYINTTADPDQPLMRSNVFTLLAPEDYTQPTCFNQSTTILTVHNVTCA